MKKLLVYYSLSGNTAKIAKKIAEKAGCDIAEIKTKVPYTGDYNSIVSQGEDEVNSGFMPEILPLEKNPADYNEIILGTPVWWYTFAPAVKTFLSQTDFSGKQVFPYATNGGWIGHTFKDVERACKNATVGKGLNIRFNGSSMQTSEKEIDKWAEEL